jgi:guanosine-3',5'-bis(diphosphate) 3'-pyrophosphohydrolase
MQQIYHHVKSYLDSFQDNPEEVKEVLALIKRAYSPNAGISKEELQELENTLHIAMAELSVYSTALQALIYIFLPHFHQKGKNQKIDTIVSAYAQLKQINAAVKDKQTETYLNYVLVAMGDLRALLIAIAINLQELRAANKQGRKDDELLEINRQLFIPICHRLGFYRIKSELEDHVMHMDLPQIYEEIVEKIESTSSEREQFIREFILPIKKELDDHKLRYKIKWRTKSVSSIYTKMNKQKIPFEKVYDLFAIRIIVESLPKQEKADCWHVFSVVTNLYAPEISRLRDWISNPRPNGYESLHITVNSLDKKPVEVQIRTHRMDDEAENGLAAHWRYKGGKSDASVNNFLLQIRKAIEGGTMGEELYQSQVDTKELFVYTPRGELRKLKKGATVLDFAFAIHTEVGIRCSGARVNGKIKTIKHSLENGDRVEIITSKTQKPTIDWLNFVQSSRAKSRIRKAIDERKRLESEQGKEILLRKLRHWKTSFNQELVDFLSAQFKYKNISDLYRDIYLEKLSSTSIKTVLKPDREKDAPDEYTEIKENSRVSEGENDLIVDETDQLTYKLARCCHPVPGDMIFGFVTIARGITIHRNTCPNAKSMKERYPYRILPAKWKSKEEPKNFRTQLFIKGMDREGVLSDIAQIVSAQAVLLQVNISSVGRFFQGKITVGIKENAQIQLLQSQLLKHQDVSECYRVKS